MISNQYTLPNMTMDITFKNVFEMKENDKLTTENFDFCGRTFRWELFNESKSTKLSLNLVMDGKHFKIQTHGFLIHQSGDVAKNSSYPSLKSNFLHSALANTISFPMCSIEQLLTLPHSMGFVHNGCVIKMAMNITIDKEDVGLVVENSNTEHLFSEVFSDATIHCDGKTIPIHKIIVSKLSPVFKAMFTSQMSECTTNEIVITDLSPDVVKEMLRFMYTGELSSADDFSIQDLFEIAQKYQIDSLADKMEKKFLTSITVENAADLLLYANNREMSALKAACMRFVYTNHTSFFPSMILAVKLGLALYVELMDFGRLHKL